LFLLHQILAEWRERRKLVACGFHIGPFADQIVLDRPPQRWIGDEMGRMGSDRQVTAGKLVFALSACLNPGELGGDGELDRLLIAKLEMQERVVLGCAPVTPVECVGTDEIDRTGDPASGTSGHD
jgi:hypothetical protein